MKFGVQVDRELALCYALLILQICKIWWTLGSHCFKAFGCSNLFIVFWKLSETSKAPKNSLPEQPEAPGKPSKHSILAALFLHNILEFHNILDCHSKHIATAKLSYCQYTEQSNFSLPCLNRSTCKKRSGRCRVSMLVNYIRTVAIKRLLTRMLYIFI